MESEITKDELYNEHLQEMFGIANIAEYSDKDIERVFDRLLRCLPNGGKLYKYRSMEGQAFDRAYDGLKNGYLYLPNANTVNDDFDCTLNFDLDKAVDTMAEIFYAEPWHYLDNWMKANMDQLQWRSKSDIQAYATVRGCVDKNTWLLDEKSAVKKLGFLGISECEAKKYIQSLLNLAKNKIEQCAEFLKKSSSSLVNFNKNNQQNIYIYSMSEDYDSDSMWAHYANSNKGFCIEYDFNKVKGLPAKDKRYFISMYKVIYKETLDEYSFVPMLEYYFSGKTDKEKLKQANMDTLLRLITKDLEWDKEKEWRIFLCNLDDNKIFADIVSSIIIDERVLKSENAKKLIFLARKKEWSIRVRKNNSIGRKHIYEELKSEAK